jgi:hypothetical protein
MARATGYQRDSVASPKSIEFDLYSYGEPRVLPVLNFERDRFHKTALKPFRIQ